MGSEAIRVVVISDTHGSVELAERAVKSVEPVDAVVHLGDFRHDGLALAKLIDAPVHVVRGDNDPWEGEKELEWLGHKVIATHGHYYDVDSSLDSLLDAARQKGARAALFGHDHRAGIKEENGITIVNPGSLFFVEKKKTFAVLEISHERIMARIFKIDQNK